MIKRVAALPGEPCPDPPPLGAIPSKLSPEAGQPVPAGRLVVIGDNHDSSYDSRVFGYYPADRVLGVMIRLMSASQSG
jgi:signal peptidase I